MKTPVIPNQEIIRKAREEIERKSGKAPEELFAERDKRVRDTIDLKVPDRVPVAMAGDYFHLKNAGVPLPALFYNHPAYKQAFIRSLLDFEPDACMLTPHMVSGLAMEALDMKQVRWPGGTLPPDSTHQFIETENMKVEEYDLFITDPTDFMLRYYLPRVFGAMAPLSELPPLGETFGGTFSGFLKMTQFFASPEFQEAAQAVLKAGQEQAKFGEFSNWEEEISDLGFPPTYYLGGGLGEPFMFVACFLRGLRGTVTDMFLRPEKLQAASERVLEWKLARAEPADPTKRGYPRRVRAGGFHYSSDRFLSKKQFATFSWPTWKKALLATIDLGYIPALVGEGKTDDRLEFLLELPKGKFFVRFDEVDMARAKAILGGHCCIAGNVPAALLQFGSPQDVDEYCKNLIKVCGKGGGFILDCARGLGENAKPANVKAMMDSVKKYGRY